MVALAIHDFSGVSGGSTSGIHDASRSALAVSQTCSGIVIDRKHALQAAETNVPWRESNSILAPQIGHDVRFFGAVACRAIAYPS